MTDYDPAATVAMRRLAQALLVASITVSGMAADMLEWNATHDVPSDADPIPEVLVKLMAGSFDYLLQRHGVRQLKAATQIIEHAHDLICSEIFVVSDEFVTERGDEIQREP